MLKNELNLRNPLRYLGNGNEDLLSEGSFGAVMAPAGVGKTAFLVQLAINAMFKDKNVLHVSMAEPVTKVSLWYEKLFQDLAWQHNFKNWERILGEILPHRFIMTFKIEGFTVPKLEERLTDLTAQGVFRPDIIVIDRFPFRGPAREPLQELKRFAGKEKLRTWFSVTTHRHEAPTAEGLPLALQNIDDLFEVILQLEPSCSDVVIKPFRGIADHVQKSTLSLDPATMLLKSAQ
jgi:hypothetical protein